jgi:hypothetical protein
MFAAVTGGAMISWEMPEFSLMAVAFLACDALFGHFLPTVFTQKYSPGVISATLFVLPAAACSYYLCDSDGFLTHQAIIVSVGGGVATFLFVMLVARISRGPVKKIDA